jgi:hypothetical protein
VCFPLSTWAQIGTFGRSCYQDATKLHNIRKGKDFMSDTRKQFTSSERINVYCLMFLLNRSFHFIVQRLGELGKASVLNSRDLKDMLGLTQEAQLEINITVLNTLETLESNDHARFGKVRSAMEKRLQQR